MNSETIKNCINTQLGTDSDWQLTPLTGGSSNLTFLAQSNERQLILRTSPPGTKSKGAHNMKREYDWLTALHPTFPKCPEPIFYSDDPSYFERPFYAMEPIQGDIIRNQLPSHMDPIHAPQLCQEWITTFHQLHRCDTSRLGAFDKGEGYIDRQLKGWSQRYEMVKPNHKPAHTVSQWLSKQNIKEQPHCPIHNDYKFDNLVFKDNKIIGVLDWELATVGDPFMDLGCSLAYWVEAEDDSSMKKLAMMPTHLPTMWRRDELVHQYCTTANLAIDDYRFYYVYGLFRLAVIAQQIFYRYEHGQNPNPAFASLGHVRDLMLSQALENIS